MPSARVASSCTKEPAKCGYPSRLRTPTACRQAHRPQNATLISTTRLSHWLLLIFFSAVSKVLLNRPADRRLAHLNAASCKENLAPLFVGSPGTSLEVCFEQAHGASIQLRTRARGLLGGKRTILCKPLKVAPDRRTVYSEPTGGLALRDALHYSLYYLSAQIYRIGFHLPMMPTAATSSQAAVIRGSQVRILPGAPLATSALLSPSSYTSMKGLLP